MALNEIISSIFKRGTLGRYALTGLFNGSIFWIGWEIARIFSDGSTLQENMSWAIAWTLSSAVAFFTHNKFTFTSHGNLNKMFVATFLTYMITVACSTTSYDFFVGIIDIPRLRIKSAKLFSLSSCFRRPHAAAASAARCTVAC